jgi:DNA-binding CsgD family transcriptional regulator
MVRSRRSVKKAMRVKSVVAGRSVVDPAVVERLVEPRVRQGTSPLNALAPRERQVIREMAEGRTNAAIGARLHLSESAIEKYVNAIFTKLDLGAAPESAGESQPSLPTSGSLLHDQTPPPHPRVRQHPRSSESSALIPASGRCRRVARGHFETDLPMWPRATAVPRACGPGPGATRLVWWRLSTALENCAVSPRRNRPVFQRRREAAWGDLAWALARSQHRV